jgi:hypothetical protein
LSQYGGKLLKDYDAPLHAIWDEFSVCQKPDKKDCYSKMGQSVRYHYVDTRVFENIKGIVINDQLVSWLWSKGSQTASAGDEFSKCFVSYKDDIFKYLFGLSDDGFYYHTFLSLIGHKIGEKFDIDQQKKYHQLYLEHLKKEQSKSYASNLDKGLLKVYKDSTQSFLTLIICAHMDLYFLHRLFIAFDKQKLSRGPSKCQAETYPRNIIIYVGDAHANNYADVFEVMSVKPDLKIINDYSSKCIELSQPFDFFSS